MKNHVQATPISAANHLRREMLKVNQPQADNKLYELIDCFALVNQHEHFNNLETEGKDIMPDNTTSKNMRVEHTGEIKQSSFRHKARQEPNTQTHS